MIVFFFVLNQKLVLQVIYSIAGQSNREIHNFFEMLLLLICNRPSLAERHLAYELNNEPSAVLFDDMFDPSELSWALVLNILSSEVGV